MISSAICLRALDADAFQTCFIAWIASLTKLGPDIVAIDGKTLRRSYQEGGAKAPIHMISAWSARQRLVLGQTKVTDTSNEITAIPELLDPLTVKGTIVTIDATVSACRSQRFLKERHAWAGLRSIVMVASIREIAGGKTEQETRFHISSLCASAERQGDARRVRVHEFVNKELGKAVPYGVYDVAANAGFVSVGITSDTAEFAVEAIRICFGRMGRERYSKAQELTITADCGGSNGARLRLWKTQLQKLADETGLLLHVHHYPPGTPKWNRIEHRLFCHIPRTGVAAH